jgi:hypothetical protein
MRAIHWAEVDLLVQEHQSLLGFQLQEVGIRLVHRASSKGSFPVLVLGLYGRVEPVWFSIWAVPEAPILTTEASPVGVRAHRALQPIELFVRSHFLGRRLVKLERVAELGRVVRLILSLRPDESPGEEPELLISLIPHRTDVWVAKGSLSVSWLRRQRPEPNASNSETSAASLAGPETRPETRPRSRLEAELRLLYLGEQEGSVTDVGLNDRIEQRRIEKQLEKRRRAVLAMREDLEKKRQSPWGERAFRLQAVLYQLDSRRTLRLQAPEVLKDLEMALGAEADGHPWWDLRPSEALESAFSKRKDLQRREAEGLKRLTQAEAEISELERISREPFLAPGVTETTESFRSTNLAEARAPAALPQSRAPAALPQSRAPAALPQSRAPAALPQSRAPAAQHRRLILAEGLECVVGKSARDNLALLRAAKPHDIWLHLRDRPGAHGFVRRAKGRAISDEELAQAARFLIETSLKKRSRELAGQRFDVSIAECRYIRPIKGDRHGQVQVQEERVMTVRIT